eukprot:CAMPEP_0197013732 /NCGR_PEP_ID=MMETSP1380-20130617/67454_1 /TAXON_ID=5936 /ORGANISM="Euplotes crassus, Strain CT5" /LENGTH=155 /DNA_ID=CAMNT_0042438187 /DNA_START=232 /DNA_END=696 /DNA_ORIENTATION=+
MNAGATEEHQHTEEHPISAQAGEESISINLAKKVNANNKIRKKFTGRHQNQHPQKVDRIDLRHNSSISELLKTTSNHIIRETEQEYISTDKIQPFEFEFSQHNVNDTVDNHTKGQYIEPKTIGGKAIKRMQKIESNEPENNESLSQRIQSREVAV